MSNNGKFTSLELNVFSGLMNNYGLRINPQLTQWCGVYDPSYVVHGNLVNNTVLKYITLSLSNVLNNCVKTQKLTINTWRQLLEIGKDSCPALSNSKSIKFRPTFPGYGSWDFKTVNDFGDVSESETLNLIEDIYPPKNYGKEKKYSYIYNKYGDYAWVTGWPARNTWQEVTDEFSAAYLPSITETNITDYDLYFGNGFLTTIARQAYYEFWSKFDTRRPNQYREFIKFFQQAHQWKNSSNKIISSFVNASTYLKGNYSNINDLTTSDIAGVNLAFRAFGTDLINLGKSLDLAEIHLFGLPSKFLLTLQKHNAITESLKLALLLSDIESNEYETLVIPTYTPSAEQEIKIYNALQLIKGDDLDEIKIILNCATTNLDSLSDLLNPIKMFPNSFQSLTVPSYNILTLSIKNYDLIYNGNDVNPLIENWGDYLENIYPDHLAIACGAFMMTMNQIKNIRQMDLEKLAQVIINLESTNKNLPLINSTYAIPGHLPAMNEALATLAFGTGNSNLYKFTDVLGSMSGIPYNNILKLIKDKLDLLPTADLEIIYKKIYQKSIGNDWDKLGINSIDAAKNDYTIAESSETGKNLLILNKNVENVLTTGDRIIITNDEFILNESNYQIYIVTEINENSITLSTALVNDVFENNNIFIYNNEYENTLKLLIDVANICINEYKVKYGSIIDELNVLWDKINNQLSVEQLTCTLIMKEPTGIAQAADNTEVEQFVRNLSLYALETQYGEVADVIENISDLSNVYGQSIVGAMREARNLARIQNAGGEIDTDIEDEIPVNSASAVPLIINGKIDSVEVTSGGYGYTAPPEVSVLPQGGIFGGSGQGAVLEAILDDDGSVAKINVIDPGFAYDPSNPPPIIIGNPPEPERLGGPVVLGSLAGSPYTDQDPVPDELVPDDDASFTVDEAIDEIIRCKCSC